MNAEMDVREQLADRIAALLDDELACSRHGLTDQTLAIQKERIQLELLLKVLEQRTTT